MIANLSNLLKEYPYTLQVCVIGIVCLLLLIVALFKHMSRRHKTEEQFPLSIKSVPANVGSITAVRSVKDESKNDDPVSMIADKMGVSPAEVKVILGIPLSAICNAKTVEEAENAYENAEENSDEEYVALLKWVELENDINYFNDLWDKVENFHTLCDKLDAKWAPLSIKEISEIKTEQDFDTAMTNAPTQTFLELVKAYKKLI